MNNLVIEKTSNTPAVQANGDTGILAMQGDSYPENSFEFFQPIIDWVEKYLDCTNELDNNNNNNNNNNTPPKSLQLNLELIYLNTSSVRALMDILDLLETARANNQTKVGVRWTYDSANERVGDLAREFSEDWEFPFEVLPK